MTSRRAGTTLVALAAVLLCACSREASRRSDAGIVVAEVDNVPIVLRDVKGEILSSRGYAPTLEERGPGKDEVSDAIRLLVERAVVLQEGSRRGIAIPFAALEEEVNRYRADFPPGGMEKALLRMGMTQDEWRERLKSSLLYRKSADAIASSLVTVTLREVTEAYRSEGKPGERPERIRVRQFLFESGESAEAARGRLAREGRGAPDGGAAAEGVDLGWFSREELPPELPEGLFGMKEGEVSGPVPLEGSASLFRLEEREAARVPSLQTEEGRIHDALLSARREAAFQGWLSRACANANVKVRADLLEELVEGKR